jgi:hypothetical protein
MPDRLPDGNFVPEGRGVPAGNGWKWIADAWAFTADQRLTFVGVFLLLFVLQIVANFIPIIGPLAMTFLNAVFWGGLVLGCDAVRRGERLEVGHLFAGFQRHAGKLIALGLVSIGLAIVIGIIMAMTVGAGMLPTLLGGGPEPTPEQALEMLGPMLLSVLIVLALSIPITMAFLFSVPLIVLNDADVFGALRTSFFACLKNILPFLIWGVAMFALAIVASIPLFLGWLLLAPIAMVSLYVAYRDIFYEA